MTDRITLKNVKVYTSISEETLCFEATVYLDGKAIARAVNRGFGGETEIAPYNYRDNTGLNEAWAYCKTLPPHQYPATDDFPAMEIPSTLVSVVDRLLDQHLEAKDNQREAKRLERDCAKGIVHKTAKGWATTSWKVNGRTATLASVLLVPNGVETVRKLCEQLKAEGKQILNTNLPFAV